MQEIIKKEATINKILRIFYSHVGGRTTDWADLTKVVGNAMSISDNDLSDIYHYLLEKGMLTPYGAGRTCFLTQNGLDYLTALGRLKEKEIVLEALQTLKQLDSFDVRTIFDYIGVSETQSFRKDILDLLYEHKLVERATGDDWFVKITPIGKKLTDTGYDSLFDPKPKAFSGDTITISGSNHNVILKSSHSTIDLKSGDLEKVIPKLLDFLQQIRAEDTSLLLAAVQDIKAGKELDASKYERIAGFLSNMATIVSAVMPG